MHNRSALVAPLYLFCLVIPAAPAWTQSPVTLPCGGAGPAAAACTSFNRNWRALQQDAAQTRSLDPANPPAACVRDRAGAVSVSECVLLVHETNRELGRRIEEARIVISAARPFSALEDAAIAQAAAARGLLRQSATAASYAAPQYGFYLGPNFSLNGSGNWKEGVEVLGRFDSGIFAKDCAYVFSWCRGVSEISYQTIAALETDGAGTEVPASNIFNSSGGYWRLNFGGQGHFSDWLGVQLVLGMSSLPNTTDHARVEPRVAFGPHFQTIYGDGAFGQVFFGYAYDEFWEREVFNTPGAPTSGTHAEANYDRYYVDALLFLPLRPFASERLHLAARVIGDAPVDGQGPSDVRVSVLFYYDLSGWLQTFSPLPAGELAAR